MRVWFVESHVSSNKTKKANVIVIHHYIDKYIFRSRKTKSYLRKYVAITNIYIYRLVSQGLGGGDVGSIPVIVDTDVNVLLIGSPLVREVIVEESSDLLADGTLDLAGLEVVDDALDVLVHSGELLSNVAAGSHLDVEDGVSVVHHRGIDLVGRVDGGGALDHVDVEVEELDEAGIGGLLVHDVSGEGTSNGVSGLSGDTSGIEVGDTDGEEEGVDAGDVGLDGRVDVDSEELGVVVLGLAVASEGAPELVVLGVVGLLLLVVVGGGDGVVGVVPDDGLVPGEGRNGDDDGTIVVVVVGEVEALLVGDADALVGGEVDVGIGEEEVVVGEVGRNLSVELLVDVVHEVESLNQEGVVEIVGVLEGSIEDDGDLDVVRMLALNDSLGVGDVGDVGVSHGNGGLVLEGVLDEALHPGRHEGDVDVGDGVGVGEDVEVAGDVAVAGRDGLLIVVLVADGLVVEDLGSLGEGVVGADVLVGSAFLVAELAVAVGAVADALVERKSDGVLGVVDAGRLGVDDDVTAGEGAVDHLVGGNVEGDLKDVGVVGDDVLALAEVLAVEGAGDHVLGDAGDADVGDALVLLDELDVALADGGLDVVGDTTGDGGLVVDVGLDDGGDLDDDGLGALGGGSEDAAGTAGHAGVVEIEGEAVGSAVDDIIALVADDVVLLDETALAALNEVVALDADVDGVTDVLVEDGSGGGNLVAVIAVGEGGGAGNVNVELVVAVVVLARHSLAVDIGSGDDLSLAALVDLDVLAVSKDSEVLTFIGASDVLGRNLAVLVIVVVLVKVEDIDSHERGVESSDLLSLEVGVCDFRDGLGGTPGSAGNNITVTVFLVRSSGDQFDSVVTGKTKEDSGVGIEALLLETSATEEAVLELVGVGVVDLEALSTSVGGGVLLHDDDVLVAGTGHGTGSELNGVLIISFVVGVDGNGVGEITDDVALEVDAVAINLLLVAQSEKGEVGVILPVTFDVVVLVNVLKDKFVVALGETSVVLVDVHLLTHSVPVTANAGGVNDLIVGQNVVTLSLSSFNSRVVSDEDDGVVAGLAVDRLEVEVAGGGQIAAVGVLDLNGVELVVLDLDSVGEGVVGSVEAKIEIVDDGDVVDTVLVIIIGIESSDEEGSDTGSQDGGVVLIDVDNGVLTRGVGDLRGESLEGNGMSKEGIDQEFN